MALSLVFEDTSPGFVPWLLQNIGANNKHNEKAEPNKKWLEIESGKHRKSPKTLFLYYLCPLE